RTKRSRRRTQAAGVSREADRRGASDASTPGGLTREVREDAMTRRRDATGSRRSLLPGAWLGLLGGGQLGRMFCMAAQSLGYKVAVLDPGDDSPAGSVADRHLRADYLDPRALSELAALCAAATTEFENVPAPALEVLARE